MKRILSVLLAASMAVSVSACGSDNPAESTSSQAANTQSEQYFSYTFTDSSGEQIVLTKRPAKVAVLFSSFAEIWNLAGGHTDITVGESIDRGFADEDAVLVDPGVGHTSIDLETLVNSEPDLVIGTADFDCQKQAVESCRSAGIPAAMFRVENFNDYLTVLRTFCDITGNDENYRQYGSGISEQIESMLSEVSGLLEKGSVKAPKILFVRAGSSAKSTKAKNSEDNFVCEMLRQLGTSNIADNDAAFNDSLSLEAVVSENPDYMFISTMGDENAAKDFMNSLLESDGWKELDCVKNGDYTYLPKDMFHYKPNAQWAQAYKYLTYILYPEITL